MNCASAREWLLEADAPDNFTTTPAEIVQHLRACPECLALIQDLVKLEEAWRALPLPAESETSKAAFLRGLQDRPFPAKSIMRPRRRVLHYGMAVSAMLLLFGVTMLLFWPTRTVEAHGDVIEQLIDWNLDLCEASGTDRPRIFAEKHENFQKLLHKAKLDPQERVFAEHLLANGVWLARNEDPVEEMHRFNHLADQLLAGVNVADFAKSERYARQFRKVNERGIDRNMRLVISIKTNDPEQRKFIKTVLKHDADRAEQIAGILERSPDISKKELRAALEWAHKRQKLKK